MAKINQLPTWLTGTPGQGIRVLPQAPTWGQTLAGAVGTGLGGWLEGLATEKAAQIKRERMGKAAQEVGLPENIADFDPRVQRELIRQMYGGQTPLEKGLGSLREKSDYTTSPTYQSQVLKNLDRRISRIIGGNKKYADEIAEMAYNTFQEAINNGVPINQALNTSMAAARDLKKELIGEQRVIKTQRGKRPRTATQSESSLKKLTTKDVDRYLIKANYDANKARELARSEGYEV